MKNLFEALQSVAATLWVGGMWVTGFMVAPLLFARLGDRAMAGLIAGRLFTLMSLVGLGCAAYLLLFRLLRDRGRVFAQGVFWTVLVMLLLIVAGEFGVQPIMEGLKEQALPREVMESVFRDRFATWHGVASILYVIESVLGVILVALLGRGR